MIGKPGPETDEQIRELDDECIDRFGVDLLRFTDAQDWNDWVRQSAESQSIATS